MVIIKDPIMEPFHIERDKYQYILLETGTTNGKHHLSKNTPTEFTKKLSFHSSFGKTLEALAEQKLWIVKEEYNSLREYIDEWGRIKNELKTLIHE